MIGDSLCPPPPQDTWLKVQAGLGFTAFGQNPAVMASFVRPKLWAWASKYGVQWHLRSLPFLQFGPVPYSTMGFLAQSLKSYSQARRYVIDGPPEGANIKELPLWHSAIFRNSDHLTYYCPALIRKGVMCIAYLFDMNVSPRQDLLPKIGITWQDVYSSTMRRFNQLLPTDWSIPSVWVGSWGKSASLKKLYRCVVMGVWEAKGFLPPNSGQTNNKAELLAVITILEHFLQQQVRLAVVMDSQYVYDGLRGSAVRWRTAGWVG